MSARMFLILTGAVALSASAQTPPSVQLLALAEGQSSSQWSAGPLVNANDVDPRGFAVQCATSLTGARIAFFARAEAPPETLSMLDANYPGGHGMDLTPLPSSEQSTFSVTAPQATFSLSGPGIAVTYSQVQTTLGLMAASASTNGPVYTVPWSGASFPGVGGYGTPWPATQTGWTASTYNMLLWTPSYVNRSTSTAAPGGQLTTFSFSRLLERAILCQSTNPTIAREFIRSVSYGTAYQNSFFLNLQAAVILPAQGTNPPVISVYTTGVFRSFVHLTPGGVLENYYPVGGVPDQAMVARAGLIFDGGQGQPVCLTLGNAADPVAVFFGGPNGTSCEVNAIFSLDPYDPFCPYYVMYRPAGISGPILTIEMASEGGEEDIEPTPFLMLPPAPGALPLYL